MPLSKLDFPASVEEITADWLNRTLPVPALPRVTGVRAVRIGQDEGFSGCRLYRLVLDRGGQASSLVAKLSPADPAEARRMAGANGREVAFYARHASAPGLPLPDCHLARFDPGTGASLLLLQDLGALRAVPFGEGLAPDEAALALRALARVHARLPGHTDPCGDLQDLQRRHPFGPLWAAYPDHVARVMPDVVLQPALRALGDRIADDPVAACARLAGPGPHCLLHGDAQADNLRFGGNGARLLDWQMTGCGTGITDAAYLLISSLAPALRRLHERRLLEGYRAALAAEGGSAPGGDDAYRRAAAAKLWVTVVATLHYDNSSPARQVWRRTDLQRLAAFCTDHDPAGTLR